MADYIQIKNGSTDALPITDNLFRNDGLWQNAPVGVSAYKYEGHNATTYNIPNAYVTVIVFKSATSNGGVAYATDWRRGAGESTWINVLHGTWQGWKRLDSNSLFRVTYADSLTLAANGSQSFALAKAEAGCVPVMAILTLGSYGDWCTLNQEVSYGTDNNVHIIGYVKSWNSGQITVALNTTILWRRL